MACKMEKQCLDPWVGESPYILILGTLPGTPVSTIGRAI